MEQNGQWLRRINLDGVVRVMERYSCKYEMPWCDSWQRHLDDPTWLGRAIDNTFIRLDETDTVEARPVFEEWLWHAANFDLATMARRKYMAEVGLLDRYGRRIYAGGEYQTVLLELDGPSREDSIRLLDRKRYEFVRWWH